MKTAETYEALRNGVGDSCTGRVIGKDRGGLYLELANGDRAYARFGFLPIGTEVICSYLKAPGRGFLFALVGIDSIPGCAA